ncbi:hypothetical protein K501DRAFT_199796 [Backusella circina FSU 941]|nr:hypothetical protein K501DRAFT_199796 [Backusella circina FSU 941]
MLKALLLTLSAALVYGSSVEITSPSPNDVWETGSTVQIKWKVNDSKTNPLRIQYASGPAQALKIDGLIAHNVSASAGQYSWKVPSDVKPKS